MASTPTLSPGHFDRVGDSRETNLEPTATAAPPCDGCTLDPDVALGAEAPAIHLAVQAPNGSPTDWNFCEKHHAAYQARLPLAAPRLLIPTTEIFGGEFLRIGFGEFLRIGFGKVLNTRSIESAEVYQTEQHYGLKIRTSSGREYYVKEEPYLTACAEESDLAHELAVMRNRAVEYTAAAKRGEWR